MIGPRRVRLPRRRSSTNVLRSWTRQIRPTAAAGPSGDGTGRRRVRPWWTCGAGSRGASSASGRWAERCASRVLPPYFEDVSARAERPGRPRSSGCGRRCEPGTRDEWATTRRRMTRLGGRLRCRQGDARPGTPPRGCGPPGEAHEPSREPAPADRPGEPRLARGFRSAPPHQRFSTPRVAPCAPLGDGCYRANAQTVGSTSSAGGDRITNRRPSWHLATAFSVVHTMWTPL